MFSDSRIYSVDLAKGIALILILYLIEFSEGITGDWFFGNLYHSGTSILYTLILSFFFFVSGIAVPFRLSKRINDGQSVYDILKSVFAISLIMITAGAMLVNIPRVNKELTGFGPGVWAVILVISIFLVWNRYPEKDNNFFTVSGLRITGLAILVFLVFKFRSGTWENNGSLITGHWEIPGLYGWGLLASSLIWLIVRNSVSGTVAAWFFFLALNIFSVLGLNNILNPAHRYFGVLIDGYIPFIFISGMLAGVMIKHYPSGNKGKLISMLTFTGIIMSAAGLLLYFKVLPPEGLYGQPSWALTGAGLSMLLFVVILYFYDLEDKFKIKFAENTGRSFFTGYIIAFFLYGIADIARVDLHASGNGSLPALSFAVPLLFSFVVTCITVILSRIGIRLRF